MEKNEFQLERISPECAGISSGQVETCIRRLMHGRTNMNGFMAARNGKVFAETWWHPYGPRLVHSNHSFGKSYTATAIGIALKEKKLSWKNGWWICFPEKSQREEFMLRILCEG